MSKRIGVLTAILVLAVPALAGAKIVVNSSIAGVKLGESKAAVHKAFGNPTKVVAASSMTQGQTQWVYKGRALLIGFKSGKVVEVFTENPHQRTASGIGVGSSKAAVTSHVKGVKCQHVANFPGQECVTQAKHGATLWTTDFHVGTGGRVQSVLVNILSGGAALDRAAAAAL